MKSQFTVIVVGGFYVWNRLAFSFLTTMELKIFMASALSLSKDFGTVEIWVGYNEFGSSRKTFQFNSNQYIYLHV
jgi:hypothetical protein